MRRRNRRWQLGLIALLAVLVLGVVARYRYGGVVLLVLDAWGDATERYQDEDYRVDWENRFLRVGTALRLARGGLLTGKPRYYVILIDRRGREPAVLYEGASSYPDVPPRPRFVSASGDSIEYEIVEGEHPFLRVFDLRAH